MGEVENFDYMYGEYDDDIIGSITKSIIWEFNYRVRLNDYAIINNNKVVCLDVMLDLSYTRKLFVEGFTKYVTGGYYDTNEDRFINEALVRANRSILRSGWDATIEAIPNSKGILTITIVSPPNNNSKRDILKRFLNRLIGVANG